jgi:hypothetical protein
MFKLKRQSGKFIPKSLNVLSVNKGLFLINFILNFKRFDLNFKSKN